MAFSGGYDSMCLLDILCNLGCDVVAVHLNHNWRGEESKKDEDNCRLFAKNRGIKFYTEMLPDCVEKTETAARDERYKFFKRCAKMFNSNVVFTAHNFDDNAETVLYRIIKGTGTVGLEGISEHRDIFYRPLLNVSRENIEKYAKDNNLSPNVDSSNFNPKYKRNFIRHKIIPLLKEINPKVCYALNSLSELAREDNEIINKYLTTDFLEASKQEQKRLIYKILVDNNIDYDREKIENLQKFIEKNKNSKSGKRTSIADDLWLYVSDKKVEVVTSLKKNEEQVQITHCGKYRFEDYEFSIEACDKKIDNNAFPKDDDFVAYISTDKIDFVLRHRQDGDRITPLGLCGSQKIKKYLNEKKIPAHEKDKLILLTRDKEVFWVAGVGLSDKIKVTDKPTHVIKLKLK